jgi:hypothetical protein
MTNWSSFPSTGARVTIWNYHPYRGWLPSKQYADGLGPNYTYTFPGRLQTRTWASGIVTSNTWDNAGRLSLTEYDDGTTPSVSFGYDRLGRQHTATYDGAATTFNYNLAGILLSESYSGGPLNGICISNRYDQYLRRTNLLFKSPICRGGWVCSAHARGRAAYGVRPGLPALSNEMPQPKAGASSAHSKRVASSNGASRCPLSFRVWPMAAANSQGRMGL